MATEFIERIRPHKWQINVNARGDIDSLAHRMPGNDIDLSYEEDMGLRCFAYSSHIDGLDNEKAVADRAYSLEVILNGAFRIDSEEAESHRIKFTEVVRLDTGLSCKINPEVLEEYPFDTDVPLDQPILDASDPKRSFASYLIHLSKSDENLRTLVMLVGLLSFHSALEKVLAWGTLYKIYDTVKFVSNEVGIDFLSLADQKQLNQFTAACNNMSVLGISARHGLAKNLPPKNPLTDLSAATNLVVKMASKFSREYVASKYP